VPPGIFDPREDISVDEEDLEDLQFTISYPTYGDDAEHQEEEVTCRTQFGYAVAIQDDLILAGAPREDAIGQLIDTGDYRFFRFNGAAWEIEWRPFPGDFTQYEYIGRSVALEENIAVVGADAAEFKTDDAAGLARILEYNGEDGWTQIEILRPIDGDPMGDQVFANSVALDGSALLAGAPGDDEAGTNAGAAYFFDLSGQTGTRCILTDVAVQFGTPISVSLSQLKTSEDTRARIRSRFGFTASEANLAETRIGATNHVENPTALDLLIEARLNQSGGTMKVRVRNWNTNSFNQVRQYSIGSAETVEPVMDIPAANYIRLSDNRVELSLRSSAVATFSAQGFEQQTDFVNILVHD
jgi:hypothetical protein